MKQLLLFLLLTVFASLLQGQAPKKWTSGEIYAGIEKLNFLGSALYVAAHPDDENTRLISYLANEVKANTAYLSLTRGDGGQNLIGSEIRELLGAIRTQELIAARKTDGGQQFFSRANDFGFSKHPDETFAIWNKDEVLGDVVWVIRQFQPDIIINRFDHRTPGTTHGHHTGSGMLALEAFDLANNRNAYPDQLKHVTTWQPRRIFFNTFWWFYGSQERFNALDKSKMPRVDIGVFYPYKGKSNTEIAAESRTMHKSQGFGSTGVRGSDLEYLELIKGDQPQDTLNLFDGINTSWTRVEGGAPIGEVLKIVQQNYNFRNPSASIPNLMLAYQMIQALPDSYWKRVKTEEIKELIAACAGLFLEAVATDFSATPGEKVALKLEVVKQLGGEVKLVGLSYLPTQKDSVFQIALADNQKYLFNTQIALPDDIPYTNAYWLNEPFELGMYQVSNQLLRGKPEIPKMFKVRFKLEVAGVPLDYERDVVFKRNDPVDGELYRPFEITPPVFANLENKVYVFPDNAPQTIKVTVKAGKPNLTAKVQLKHPEGWRVEPAMVDVELPTKGQESSITFELYPPISQSEGNIQPLVTVEGEVYDDELVLIEYDHIPTLTIVRDGLAKVVRIDLKKEGQRVAYISGAGDDIPQNLRQIGYQADLLTDKEITLENLKQYDAVITGVRAYNTIERLKFQQATLLEYVKQGGTMIVQYNTNNGLVLPVAQIGPYPLKISRERVTDENAEVRFLQPEHPILNFPNKITSKDFEGWEQERGLYFCNEWDSQYVAILSSNDPNEKPLDGGLLVAQYGEGYYIYTGYSWFRELPAGVAGAYRLFANMISIGQQPKIKTDVSDKTKKTKNTLKKELKKGGKK